MSHATISNRNAMRKEVVLDYDVDSTHTPAVNLGGFPILGLLVPIVNGTPLITVEVCIDGTNWHPLLKGDGTTDAISISGGAAAFFVSSDVLTPLAAYAGHQQPNMWANDILVRLVASVAQTADRTFVWIALA